jgi:hypothetical protein
MRLLLFITLFFITVSTVAQQPDTTRIRNSQTYIADARIQVHYLKNHTSVFVDSANKLYMKEAALQTGFQPLSDNMQAQPYITYWLKFSLSATENIQKWWLLLGEHGYVDVWFLNTSNQIVDISVPDILSHVLKRK